MLFRSRGRHPLHQSSPDGAAGHARVDRLQDRHVPVQGESLGLVLFSHVADVGSRQMDKPKENIRFLDNFDVSLSLDSRADAGHQVTSIDIGIQPLVLRVSFRDILLVNSIVNRAIEMSNRSAASPPPPPSPTRPQLQATTSGKRSRTDPSRRSMSRSRRKSSVGQLQAQVIISKETVRTSPL